MAVRRLIDWNNFGWEMWKGEISTLYTNEVASEN